LATVRWHPCGIRRSAWWDLAIRVAWDAGLRWIVVDQPRMRGLLEAGAMGLRWAELGEQVERIFGPARVARHALLLLSFAAAA
jgi:hypothetical protein